MCLHVSVRMCVRACVVWSLFARCGRPGTAPTNVGPVPPTNVGPDPPQTLVLSLQQTLVLSLRVGPVPPPPCAHTTHTHIHKRGQKETELALEARLSRMHQERLPAHLVARVRMHACTRWPPGRDEHFKRRPSGETSNSSRDISQEGVRGMREPETARTTGKDAEARGNSACRSGGVNNRGWRTPALELSDVGQIRSASNRACQCPALHLAHRRSHGRLCVCARVWPQVCGHRYANLRNQQQPVCGHRCGVCGPRCASACEPVCGQGNGWAPSAHASGTNLLLSSRPSPKLFPSRAALHRGTLPHPHAGPRSTTSVASIPQHTPTYSNILQHHGAPRTWPRYSNIHAAVRYTAIHAAVHQCAHQRREDERRGGNARL